MGSFPTQLPLIGCPFFSDFVTLQPAEKLCFHQLSISEVHLQNVNRLWDAFKKGQRILATYYLVVFVENDLSPIFILPQNQDMLGELNFTVERTLAPIDRVLSPTSIGFLYISGGAEFLPSTGPFWTSKNPPFAASLAAFSKCSPKVLSKNRRNWTQQKSTRWLLPYMNICIYTYRETQTQANSCQAIC